MIIAKIDENAFLDTVRNARVIAFQRLEFGYAVADPLVAFYAPVSHPGGGNIGKDFVRDLGAYCLHRMSDPSARTLRPTAKPIPTINLMHRLNSVFELGPEPMANYPKAPGDWPEIVDSECQIVIQAIEQFERPDLKDAMEPAKRDAMSDALDFVIQHAEAARELTEVGDYEPQKLRLHLLQATQAMKTTLTYLLKP